MNSKNSIRRISDILAADRSIVPAEPGIYAFWWIGSKKTLLAGRRHIVLRGPKGKLVDVFYEDWWPAELEFPCLYVGKSTNVQKRFRQHILTKTLDRIHPSGNDNFKAKPHNTTCQLRHGIEHVFPDVSEPLKLINECVGFSFRVDFPNNPVAERFFEEDRLIGTWRPWFNIDSER